MEPETSKSVSIRQILTAWTPTYTTCCIIKKFRILSTEWLYVLVIFPTQQTVIISLYITDWLAFVMDIACVLSNTQTESLRNI